MSGSLPSVRMKDKDVGNFDITFVIRFSIRMLIKVKRCWRGEKGGNKVSEVKSAIRVVRVPVVASCQSG